MNILSSNVVWTPKRLMHKQYCNFHIELFFLKQCCQLWIYFQFQWMVQREKDLLEGTVGNTEFFLNYLAKIPCKPLFAKLQKCNKYITLQFANKINFSKNIFIPKSWLLSDYMSNKAIFHCIWVFTCYSYFNLFTNFINTVQQFLVLWILWHQKHPVVHIKSKQMNSSLSGSIYIFFLCILSTSIYDLVLIYVCHFHHHFLLIVVQIMYFSSYFLVLSRYLCFYLGSQHPRIFCSSKNDLNLFNENLNYSFEGWWIFNCSMAVC